MRETALHCYNYFCFREDQSISPEPPFPLLSWGHQVRDRFGQSVIPTSRYRRREGRRRCCAVSAAPPPIALGEKRREGRPQERSPSKKRRRGRELRCARASPVSAWKRFGNRQIECAKCSVYSLTCDRRRKVRPVILNCNSSNLLPTYTERLRLRIPPFSLSLSLSLSP